MCGGEELSPGGLLARGEGEQGGEEVIRQLQPHLGGLVVGVVMVVVWYGSGVDVVVLGS